MASRTGEHRDGVPQVTKEEVAIAQLSGGRPCVSVGPVAPISFTTGFRPGCCRLFLPTTESHKYCNIVRKRKTVGNQCEPRRHDAVCLVSGVLASLVYGWKKVSPLRMEPRTWTRTLHGASPGKAASHFPCLDLFNVHGVILAFIERAFSPSAEQLGCISDSTHLVPWSVGLRFEESCS